MEPSEQTVDSQRIYKGKVVGLRVDTVTLPRGGTSKREIVEHGGSVTIVAVDDGQNVVLVRQYRKAVESWLLEAPAGGLDEGEDPRQAVRRELQEETGYTAESIERLATFYTSPGFCTEIMHVYLATGLRPGVAVPEDDESIDVVVVSLRESLEMVRRGEIEDGKTIASLLLAVNRLNFLA